MDPSQTAIGITPITPPISSYMFAPGIFFSADETNNYISSLDSDTRDYVLKHTDEFRSREDIEDCIHRLHHGNH